MHVMDEEAVMCETNTRLHDAGVKKTRLLSGILGYVNTVLVLGSWSSTADPH